MDNEAIIKEETENYIQALAGRGVFDGCVQLAITALFFNTVKHMEREIKKVQGINAPSEDNHGS